MEQPKPKPDIFHVNIPTDYTVQPVPGKPDMCRVTGPTGFQEHFAADVAKYVANGGADATALAAVAYFEARASTAVGSV